MKIISSNIRFNNPGDGVNAWPNRKIFLSNILNNLKADIIGTQEGRLPQLKELESLLKNKSLVGQHRDWIEQRMYPCLFVDNAITVRDSFDLWLSETPRVSGTKLEDSAFPRLATVATILKDGREILLANMHLDHTIDSVREKQIEIFIREIKKIEFDGPLIICGDFNSRVGGVVHQSLIDELSLIDPWKTLSMNEETSYHQFKGNLDSGHRIDWILHSTHFICREIKLIKDSSNGLYPSDHFPVFCDIILKN
jgi:endonuclease/exonuclease/phosphatase family metal-dependent hydrolase